MQLRSAFLTFVASPDRAFLTFLAGILLIYREFMAPGRVVPGVLGAVAVIWAGIALFEWEPTAAGLLLLLAGAGFLVLQGFRTWFWAPAATAAGILFAGALLLYPSGHAISKRVAAATVPFALLSGFLLRRAVQGREKKRSA